MKAFFSNPVIATVCVIIAFYAFIFIAMFFSEKANIDIAHGQAITTQGDTIHFYGGTLEKPSLRDYRIKDIKIK